MTCNDLSGLIFSSSDLSVCVCVCGALLDRAAVIFVPFLCVRDAGRHIVASMMSTLQWNWHTGATIFGLQWHVAVVCRALIAHPELHSLRYHRTQNIMYVGKYSGSRRQQYWRSGIWDSVYSLKRPTAEAPSDGRQ